MRVSSTLEYIRQAKRANSGAMSRRPTFPRHSTLKMGIAISGTGIYLGNGLLANQWTMGVGKEGESEGGQGRGQGRAERECERE